jgi:hypothetical protein
MKNFSSTAGELADGNIMPIKNCSKKEETGGAALSIS